jgi:four helix bundle protein
MDMAMSFEDVLAWQKARLLNKAVFALTRERTFSRYFSLKDQIQRSALSVMSNITEGFERGSPAEYYRFLVIAKASCAEVRCQLYAALDTECISKEQFEILYDQSLEVSRVIAGLMKSVDSKRR